MVNTPNELRTERTGQVVPFENEMADDTAAIRREIQRTRAQMGHTIDEIQRRLSPDYLINQTQDALRETAVEKVENMAQMAENKMYNWRTSAIQTVKDNPIPSALVGIGLGWLLLSNGNDHDEYEYEYDNLYYGDDPRDTGTRYDPGFYGVQAYGPGAYRSADTGQERLRDARETLGEVANDATDWAGDAAARAKRSVDNAADSVRDQAGDVADSMRESIHSVADEAEERARMAREQVSQRASRLPREARIQYRRTKRSFWQTMEENPLAVGAAALAVGAVVGMVLPGTEKENELLGSTRDNLIDDASAMAKQTLHRAQSVAEQTAQVAAKEAKREAQKQNLTLPGQGSSSASGEAEENSTQDNVTV